MSDELRAAAERLLKGTQAYRGTTHIELLDVWSIADAWLHEHQADDGEPVTVEWLRSVGFRSWDGDEDEFELYLRIRDEICWECRLAYQENVIYAVRMCDPEDIGCVLSSESVELLNTRNKKPALTRGDVRRLCAALGITLSEGEG